MSTPELLIEDLLVEREAIQGLFNPPEGPVEFDKPTRQLLLKELLVERGEPSGFWLNDLDGEVDVGITDKEAVELIKFLLEGLVNEKN